MERIFVKKTREQGLGTGAERTNRKTRARVPTSGVVRLHRAVRGSNFLT